MDNVVIFDKSNKKLISRYYNALIHAKHGMFYPELKLLKHYNQCNEITFDLFLAARLTLITYRHSQILASFYVYLTKPELRPITNIVVPGGIQAFDRAITNYLGYWTFGNNIKETTFGKLFTIFYRRYIPKLWFSFVPEYMKTLRIYIEEITAADFDKDKSREIALLHMKKIVGFLRNIIRSKLSLVIPTIASDFARIYNIYKIQYLIEQKLAFEKIEEPIAISNSI